MNGQKWWYVSLILYYFVFYVNKKLKNSSSFEVRTCFLILDLHVGHVGGEVQKNILSVLLWAPANVGEKHCLVSPERLDASQ